MVGSILGVLFISLVRRVMVEDPELPFPESVAASEIHKAGQRGAQAAKYLFWNIGVGGVVYMLGKFGLICRRSGLSISHRQVWDTARFGLEPWEHQGCCHRRHQRICCSERESCLSRSGIHHRSAAGFDPVCRQRSGLGTAGSLDDLFPGPSNFSNTFPRTLPKIGQTWPMRYGDILCGPSRSAECWSAQHTHCSRCARA